MRLLKVEEYVDVRSLIPDLETRRIGGPHSVYLQAELLSHQLSAA